MHSYSSSPYSSALLICHLGIEGAISDSPSQDIFFKQHGCKGISPQNVDMFDVFDLRWKPSLQSREDVKHEYGAELNIVNGAKGSL